MRVALAIDASFASTISIYIKLSSHIGNVVIL